MLTCQALAANADTLGGLLLSGARGSRQGTDAGSAGQGVAHAVCVIDQPLQEDETQVSRRVSRFYTFARMACLGCSLPMLPEMGLLCKQVQAPMSQRSQRG